MLLQVTEMRALIAAVFVRCFGSDGLRPSDHQPLPMRTAARTKILLCGPPVSAVGGGPTHIRNLLASRLADRYELVHFETGSRGTESPAKDEPLLHKVVRIFISPFALAWTIVHTRARIVHINSVLDHKGFWRDMVYVLVSRSFGCRVLSQMHGGALADLCRYRPLRPLVRWALALPQAVVLLATQEIRDFAAEGITEHLHVIPNGIDVSAYQRAGAREHSGDVRRLVYMGRLVRTKGIFEAVEAIKVLRADPRFRDVELYIAGSGPDEAQLRQRIQERGLSDCIVLVGPVSGAAKIDFLRKADVFVFPTYHREGLPYCVLESLAAGTPLVTTRVAGIPDAVIDGMHGRLIESRDPMQIADAVRTLAVSSAGLKQMSRDCAARAADVYSLERLALRFEEMYEQAGVSGGRRREKLDIQGNGS